MATQVRRARDLMTAKVTCTDFNDTLQHVAQLMKDEHAGAIPVHEPGNPNKLCGMITDRDIAIRSVAEGKNPSNTLVKDVMTSTRPICCQPDDDVDSLISKMTEQRVRRLPVCDQSGKVLGMVSLGDIATYVQPGLAGTALSEISKFGGPHDQSGSSGAVKPKAT